MSTTAAGSTGHVGGAELERTAAALVTRVRDRHLVATSQQDLRPEQADRATADDVHVPTRHVVSGPQHTGERLHPDAVELAEAVRQGDDVGRTEPLGETARVDPQLVELRARRAVAGATALATPARDAVHHGHARAALELSLELVAEHGPRSSRIAQLLEVGPAQAAGTDVDELAGASGLGPVNQPGRAGGIEGDRAHRRIVRRCARFPSVTCSG